MAKDNGGSADDVHAETWLAFFAAALLQFMAMMSSFVLIGMWIYRVAWDAHALAHAN